MADPTRFQVRLVTPDHVLVDAPADAVELPGRTGYLEALPGAAPLLTELGAGEVRIHGGPAGDQRYNVAWGFAEVLPDRVTILAENAQKPDQIDRAGAEQQLRDGQKLWSEAGEDEAAYTRANEVIAEAESKLDSTSH
ncbi:MAG TPA: ATP synthase F1 subunit epsilon [Acidobacteriaceae bacterium]